MTEKVTIKDLTCKTCTRKKMSLTHLSVFSGIGGIDIAGEWAGFRTIGQVELADYPFRGALQALAGCAEMEGC